MTRDVQDIYDYDRQGPKGSIMEQSLKCAQEFASSAWTAGVTDKVNGVRQLCGAQLPEHEEKPELHGAMQLSHVAGQTAGEIAFFLGASKLVGKGLKCATTSGAALEAGESALAKSLAGQRIAGASNFLNKSHFASEIVTAGATGALAGGIFKPVDNNESSWRRVGNAVTDAATFMTLGGVAGKYAGSFTENFAGRLQLNALAGGAAGVVSTNMEALTHGRVASVEDTLMGGAGFAVGNVVTGEALHGLGKAWQKASELSAAKATEGSVEAGAEKPGREPRLLNWLSMRDIAEKGNLPLLDRQLQEYYPHLQRAFPLDGEIESIPTYVEYLTDKRGTWEMEKLLGPTIGGLQYQVLDVNGKTLGKAGWLEHIFMDLEHRGEGYGIGAFDHVKNQVQKKGGELTFWEWNNPEKMTANELREDATGGITTQDRQDWWANAGATVAVDSKGNIAPYAQPSMEEGLPEVPYLSLAFVAPESLEGRKIPVEDYLALLHTAHGTFLGDGLHSDPTVIEYNRATNAINEPFFTLVPLKDLPQYREAHQSTPAPNGKM